MIFMEFISSAFIGCHSSVMKILPTAYSSIYLYQYEFVDYYLYSELLQLLLLY